MANPEMITILDRQTRILPVKLGESEVNALARKLASLMADKGVLSKDHDERKAEIKAEMAGAEKEIDRVAAQVHRGEEDRDVEVEVRANHDQRTVSEIRLDTHAELSSRPMTAEECQRVLPGMDAADEDWEDPYDQGCEAKNRMHHGDGDENLECPYQPHPCELSVRWFRGAEGIGDLTPHERGQWAKRDDDREEVETPSANPYADGGDEAGSDAHRWWMGYNGEMDFQAPETAPDAPTGMPDEPTPPVSNLTPYQVGAQDRRRDIDAGTIGTDMATTQPFLGTRDAVRWVAAYNDAKDPANPYELGCEAQIRDAGLPDDEVWKNPFQDGTPESQRWAAGYGGGADPQPED